MSDGSYRRRDRYDDRYNNRYDDSDRKRHHSNRSRRRDYDGDRDYRTRRDGYRKSDHSSSRRRERDFDDDQKMPPKERDNRPKKMEGYGLKGGNTKPSTNRGDIGPSQELLRKKREEQQRERQRNLQQRSRKKMTEVERQQALREMQSDARKREDRMGKQASYHKPEEQDESSERKGASFLNEITTKAVEQSSLSSRVAQNRHTNQRLHDSFL